MIRPPSPYATTLALSVDTADGRIVLTMPSTQGTAGRPGFLHGGAIAALLDHAGLATARAALEPGVEVRAISIAIDFLRGGSEQHSHAAARIVRMGRRIANVHAVAWQDDEAKPIATANLKFVIERPSS